LQISAAQGVWVGVSLGPKCGGAEFRPKVCISRGMRSDGMWSCATGIKCFGRISSHTSVFAYLRVQSRTCTVRPPATTPHYRRHRKDSGGGPPLRLVKSHCCGPSLHPRLDFESSRFADSESGLRSLPRDRLHFRCLSPPGMPYAPWLRSRTHTVTEGAP
jgi:hypothetical protein